jgi:hypothetical protein
MPATRRAKGARFCDAPDRIDAPAWILGSRSASFHLPEDDEERGGALYAPEDDEKRSRRDNTRLRHPRAEQAEGRRVDPRIHA